MPILFWKKLDAKIKTVLTFTLFYLLYVILIGGDVLKVHRFFIPIFGFSAILIANSIWLLVAKLLAKTRNLILFLALFPLVYWTFFSPKSTIRYYLEGELGLVLSMQGFAQEIKMTDSTNFSVALTTIGAFSYELVGHTVIDMLGLTDSTIARHPESNITEFETTWREKKFNSTYLLNRKPDYIIFSTGVKPSAPAEQALLLYSVFMKSYKSLVWYVPNPRFSGGGNLRTAFKRLRDYSGQLVPTYPPDFVRLFKKGNDLFVSSQYQKAITAFDSAISISPEPFYSELLLRKALSHRELRQRNSTRVLVKLILEQDSLVLGAHKLLYTLGVEDGDSTAVAYHRNWIQKLAPWEWPRFEREIQAAVARAKRNQ